MRQKTKFSTLLGNLRNLNRRNLDGSAVIAELKALDEERVQYLEKVKKMNPFYGNVVAINTFLSYSNNQGDYENEIDYFANEFFQFVNYEDDGYNRLPWVYETARDYSNTLCMMNLPTDVHLAYVEKALAKWPQQGKAHHLAFGGMLTGMQQRNHPNYIPLAEKYVATFSQSHPQSANTVKSQIERQRSFSIGGLAPDFSQKTPEGEDLKLSDMRGKVVLVDFWASWCGPCRRENPNVVKLYDRYKEKGFEILGVSLDRQKDRWLQAIKKDGLEWYHVSDLKGWKNEVAQMYSVSSIPHTVLVDQNGRILARNLRGAKLEQKLAELFD